MGGWPMGGVGEVVGADDTSKDSLLAGRETTDWPGHRRKRCYWVLHSQGGKTKQRWEGQSALWTAVRCV